MRSYWIVVMVLVAFAAVCHVAVVVGLTEELLVLKATVAKQQDQLLSMAVELTEKEGMINELQREKDELRTIPALVTAYAPLDPDSITGFDYEGDPNTTATGTQVRVGVGAADFRKLPAGTVLEVPGYGVVTIEDTGMAMREYSGVQIDLVFDCRDEAFQWGRQKLDVRVVAVPENKRRESYVD